MNDQQFFTAEVERYDFGRYAYSVVWLPEELHEELPLKEHPRLRVDAEINGFRHTGTFQPTGGRWYLMLSRRVLKAAGLEIGERAVVVFTVADQNAVDVPRELADALADDQSARKDWETITIGRRRYHSHHVSSAKQEATRLRRAGQVIETVRKEAKERRAKGMG